MWLHDWCKSVAESPLYGLFFLTVLLVHLAILLHAEREMHKGYLPRVAVHTYTATLLSIGLGIFSLTVKFSKSSLPAWLDFFCGVAANLFFFAVPVSIFVWIARQYSLRRNLAWMNVFLILSYVFLTLIVNGVKKP